LINSITEINSHSSEVRDVVEETNKYNQFSPYQLTPTYTGPVVNGVTSIYRPFTETIMYKKQSPTFFLHLMLTLRKEKSATKERLRIDHKVCLVEEDSCF